MKWREVRSMKPLLLVNKKDVEEEKFGGIFCRVTVEAVGPGTFPDHDCGINQAEEEKEQEQGHGKEQEDMEGARGGAGAGS